MSVRQNERFIRHVAIIEQALNSLSAAQAITGKEHLKSMLIGAEALDSVLDPIHSDMLPQADAIMSKREAFHKECREMGEWLRANCPDVKLD